MAGSACLDEVAYYTVSLRVAQDSHGRTCLTIRPSRYIVLAILAICTCCVHTYSKACATYTHTSSIAQVALYRTSGCQKLGWRVKVVLSNAGLLRQQQIKPEYVGCSPKNRSGLWADVSRAHSLGSLIVAQGYDVQKTVNSVCIEKAEDPQVAALAESVNSNPCRGAPVSHLERAISHAHMNVYMCIYAQTCANMP